MRPYTVAIPKPLVPLGEEPILGIIIRQLKKSGFTRITIAVNHMADIIMAYAGDGSRWGVAIDYSRENKPLHTIGPLTLINDLPEHFLVMNGDTLTDINYGKFLRAHIKRGCDISVAAKKRETKIDFGVLEVDTKQYLSGFKEKPTFNSYMAVGVNCFSRAIIRTFPKGKRYGFDDLMYKSLRNKKKVWVHPHKGFWLDIGRPEDYQYAEEHFEEIKKIV